MSVLAYIHTMSTTSHECEECDTSFESKEELDKHNKDEHREK
jgi:hypothetical protein